MYLYILYTKIYYSDIYLLRTKKKRKKNNKYKEENKIRI